MEIFGNLLSGFTSWFGKWRGLRSWTLNCVLDSERSSRMKSQARDVSFGRDQEQPMAWGLHPFFKRLLRTVAELRLGCQDPSDRQIPGTKVKPRVKTRGHNELATWSLIISRSCFSLGTFKSTRTHCELYQKKFMDSWSLLCDLQRSLTHSLQAQIQTVAAQLCGWSSNRTCLSMRHPCHFLG